MKKKRWGKSTRSLITLTTDFGLRDGYVAAVKGVILSINREVDIIDITHEIGPFNVVEAALILSAFASYFPPGTIHVVVVDPGVGGKREGVVILKGRHFFVGPDNGIFDGILAGDGKWEAYAIREPRFMLLSPAQTFHARDVFAPVAAYLSLGVDPREFGPPYHLTIGKILGRSSKKDKRIEGKVVRVDRFGNLITNISWRDIKQFPLSKVVVWVGKKVKIRGVVPSYSYREAGEILATIGGGGWLEIARNLGRADNYLNVSIGSQVIVERE